MAQHFLLSAAARTLSLKDIYKGGEDAAYETFKRLRWSETNGEPVCPKCGCLEPYEITTRRKFKCALAATQFSVTSGTIFASRKLSFVDLLAAICLFVNCSKGMSSVQFSRDLDVQYKTAFVMAHKLREALAAETKHETLDGEVEIDGAYFGGHVRQENRIEDRKDRREKANQSDRRRVVIALRERAGRTLTFIRHKRSGRRRDRPRAPRCRRAAVRRRSQPLGCLGRLSTRPAASTTRKPTAKATASTPTWVESYFSRLRRMVAGQHHFVSHGYLYQYANHAAWLEDHRRRSNGSNASALLSGALHHPVSRVWKGYWQRSAA
jgi:transposase-like protein